jgi:hypothetical protein
MLGSSVTVTVISTVLVRLLDREVVEIAVELLGASSS